MDQLEEKHGSESLAATPEPMVVAVPENSVSIGSRGDLGTTQHLVSIAVPPSLTTVCAAILATGVVFGVLEFIYLSFQKPDAANLLVPLILYPLVRILADHWQGKK